MGWPPRALTAYLGACLFSVLAALVDRPPHPLTALAFGVFLLAGLAIEARATGLDTRPPGARDRRERRRLPEE